MKPEEVRAWSREMAAADPARDVERMADLVFFGVRVERSEFALYEGKPAAFECGERGTAEVFILAHPDVIKAAREKSDRDTEEWERKWR